MDYVTMYPLLIEYVTITHILTLSQFWIGAATISTFRAVWKPCIGWWLVRGLEYPYEDYLYIDIWDYHCIYS